MTEEKHIFLSEILKRIQDKILVSDYNSIDIINYLNTLLNGYYKSNNNNAINSFFPDFGLYFFNKPLYKLAIRCGNSGQKGKGGHSHNDQLSFYLNIGANKVIVESGTFTYTADYAQRNAYRSTSMHNTLQLDEIEQNDWFEGDKDDIFWLISNKASPKIIKIDNFEFIAEHYGFGATHRRALLLNDDTIYGEDICEGKGIKRVYFHFHPKLTLKFSPYYNSYNIIYNKESIIANLAINDNSKIEDYDYSPKYGVKIPAKKIIIETSKSIIKWKIAIIN